MEYSGSPCIKKLVAETKTWAEDNQHSLLLPLSHCLPPPHGYVQCMINSQVWVAGGMYHLRVFLSLTIRHQKDWVRKQNSHNIFKYYSVTKES